MLFLQVDNDAHQETTIFVVLETPNVERMAQADPVTLNSLEYGGFIRPVKYPQRTQLIVCYEPNSEQMHAMASMGGTAELVRYLMRGYNFDTKTGDGTGVKPLTLRNQAKGMQA